MSIDLTDAAGRQDDRRRIECDQAIVDVDGKYAGDTFGVAEKIDHPPALEHVDRIVGIGGGRECPLNFGSRGVSVCVNDPPPLVAALAAELEVSLVVEIELGSELDQPFDRLGAPGGEDLDGTLDGDAAADRHGVGGVELGRVVSADSRSDAALGPSRGPE